MFVSLKRSSPHRTGWHMSDAIEWRKRAPSAHIRQPSTIHHPSIGSFIHLNARARAKKGRMAYLSQLRNEAEQLFLVNYIWCASSIDV